MFKRELKVNLKSFLIWLIILIGLFLVVFLIYPSIINSENIKMIEIEEESTCDDEGTHNIYKYDVEKNQIHLTNEDPCYYEVDEDGEIIDEDAEPKTHIIEEIYDIKTKKTETIKDYFI